MATAVLAAATSLSLLPVVVTPTGMEGPILHGAAMQEMHCILPRVGLMCK